MPDGGVNALSGLHSLSPLPYTGCTIRQRAPYGTPRITQKEMTEREQRELKTLLDRARIAHGRPLTNAETNSVKKEYIDKLMVQREADAKKAAS